MNAWPELSPEVSAKVEAAVVSGRKIEAIKMYRSATSCGLKEAKEAIERGQGSADLPIRRATGPNWFVIVLAAFIVFIALAIAWARLHH
jgi:hypothetical protein